MIEKIYRRIRWLYPKRYFSWLEKNFSYAGIDFKIETFVTLSFLYSLAISLFVFSTIFLLGYGQISYLVLILCFFGLQFVFNMIIVLIGEKRGSFAESVLPDALQLMSANIRSGLTPDKALLFAARPEFGVLEKEIKLAASKAVAGESIEDSLVALGNRIKSRIVNRTFNLIVEGMKKGGEIASLLEQTADDIRYLRLLKKEVAAQVSMYAIFIFIAIGFAAPLLFAFSSYLVETMSTIGSKLNVGEAANYISIGTIRFGFIRISSDFLRNYSLLTLTIASVFGGLIIGLLQEGKENAGIKFIPILLSLNMAIYFTIKIVLSSVMGSLTPTAVLPI